MKTIQKKTAPDAPHEPGNASATAAPKEAAAAKNATARAKSVGLAADGPDGPSALSPSSPRQNGAIHSPEPSLDLIIEEHGDFFDGEGKAMTINQVAVMARFVAEFPFTYDAGKDEFRKYDAVTGHFAPINPPAIKRELAGFIKKLAAETEAGAFVTKITNGLLNAMADLLKGYARQDRSRARGDLIHLANGMLDLSSGEPRLLPFSPDYLSKRSCPVGFDAGATCERFLGELLNPAVTAEDVGLLQRFCGSVLLGRNQAQRLLIVHGAAAAGKSTFVSILERVIGVENVAHLRTEHLSGRFETHGFLNKTLLAAKDVSGDFLSTRGAKMIKALVGDDQLEAEMKFGGKYRLQGDLQVIITSNSRLKLAFEEDEEAWRRRLLMVGFKREAAAVRVPNFADVLLREEGEGILAWMVKGAVDHLAELQKMGDFELTEAQRERIEAVLIESKSPEGFVRLSVQEKEKADVTVGELWQAYVEFCLRRGWLPSTERQFQNVLADLMMRHHRVIRKNDIKRGDQILRGFKGVRLMGDGEK